ncbi:MAG: PIG-L deacetylase family protein [Acidimicrobiales bacterium]
MIASVTKDKAMTDGFHPEQFFSLFTLDWRELPNIEMANRVVEAEFFRRDVVPTPVEFTNVASILVIAPHQDDEVIGAGGILLQARQAGISISILFVTDGVITDQETPYSDDEWIGIRENEAREVCGRIGAEMHQLGISNRSCQATLEHLRRISSLIAQSKPDVVLVPWLLDAPPKHRYALHLLYLAHQLGSLPDFQIWSYQVHNTIYANAFADVTAVAEGKLDLLRCYRSQNENCRRYDHQAMGLCAWNSRLLPIMFRTMAEQYVELFYVTSRDKYFGLIRHFYLPNLKYTYQDHPAVTGAATAIQAAVRVALGPGREE